MPTPDLDSDAFDPQDAAERADETHLNEDEDEFTTLEDAPGAFNALEAEGDDDDEAALDADELADPRALDDEQVEEPELDDGEVDAYEPEVEWAVAGGVDPDEVEAAVDDALGGRRHRGAGYGGRRRLGRRRRRRLHQLPVEAIERGGSDRARLQRAPQRQALSGLHGSSVRPEPPAGALINRALQGADPPLLCNVEQLLETATSDRRMRG